MALHDFGLLVAAPALALLASAYAWSPLCRHRESGTTGRADQ